jgi:uncharacterized protein YjbJ (UPF0337 family)
MKTDQLKGKWMQFKGELKQQWGKLIGNDGQQIEGTYEKVIGMLQVRYGAKYVSLVRERYAEKKNDLIRWAEQWDQQEKSR